MSKLLLSLYYKDIYKEFLLPETMDKQMDLCIYTYESNSKNDIYITIQAVSGIWHFIPNKDVAPDGQSRSNTFSVGGQYTFNYLPENERITIIVSLQEQSVFHFSKYQCDAINEITIGSASNNVIIIHDINVAPEHAAINFANGETYVHTNSRMNAVYVNNRRVSNIRISFGDTIFIAGVKIVYLGNIIAINNPNSMVSVRIFEYQNEYDDTLSAGNMAIDDRNVKYFARSLNVTSPLKTIERDIENIPNIQRTPQKQPLIYTIGPSLTMSLAMVASLGLTFYNQNTSQAGQNGIPVTMIVGITFAFVMLAGAVLWPILSHRFQTRSLDKRNGELTDKYLKYLSKLGGELNYKQNQNRITYGKLYPSPEKCLEICLTQERLWERSPKDELFLDVRVGIGARISPIRLNISRGSTGMEPEENDEIALALRNMENEFQFLKNVPVSVKLGKFKTGVCGRYALAANIMKAMIVQAASLHEPDEVKIAVIASDKLFAEWKWVKMLPHVWNSEHSQRYTAFNNEDTAVVCNSLNEIIKKQNEDIKDNRAGERLHYIVFVLDEAQNKSAAMARLVANAQNGQFSFVFTASTSDKLPDNCLTLIQCTREANSITDLPDSSGRMFMFRPDDMSSFPVDYFARTLARVQLRKAVEGVDLVDSVSYLDMYNVSDVKALAIESRWASNEALAAKVESGTEVAFLIISGAPMAEAVGF